MTLKEGWHIACSDRRVAMDALSLRVTFLNVDRIRKILTQPDPENRVKPDASLKVIGLIATAAGYEGMVGGQAVDIHRWIYRLSDGRLQGLAEPIRGESG